MEALLHGGGHAGDLDSHVGAASAGEVLDGLLPLLQGGKVGHADHMVGAETLGHLQPLGHAVDDDGGDALLPGNGGGVESHAAGALDQQGLPGYGAEALQAVVDLGEAAVGAGSEVIGKGVGDLVEVLLRGIRSSVWRRCQKRRGTVPGTVPDGCRRSHTGHSAPFCRRGTRRR